MLCVIERIYRHGQAVAFVDHIAGQQVDSYHILIFQVYLFELIIGENRKRGVYGVTFINSPEGVCYHSLYPQRDEAVHCLLA